MPYQPWPFDTFARGLNLTAKADAVEPGEAIDALNVDFTVAGAVKQRDGYAALTSSALTNAVASLEPYYTTAGTKQLLCGCGTRLEAVNTSGAVVVSQTGLTTGTWDFCRFGAPGSEVAYAGNGKNLLYSWSGSAWASVANSPKARYLCVQASDNRLVAAGFDDSGSAGPTASQAYTSRVWFSNEGAPTSWGANNYVDLTPGDGELIQGVIAWKEFVFVFKETKYFVFTGASSDSTGEPIFNYRTVDAGIGLASPRAIVSSHSGVYFMDRTGVYRTTGQEPELLSGTVDPVWFGGASTFYTGSTLAHGSITNCAMGWHNERLYLAFPTTSANDRVLVHDPRYGWWSLYDLPAAAINSFRIGSASELVFAYSSGSNRIGRHSSSYTADVSTAITSRWRSGWFDMGSPSIKKIRQTKIWGTGVVSLGLAYDFSTSTGTLDSVDMSLTSGTSWSGSTWGGTTWGAVVGERGKLRRRAVRGTVFSTSFYNTTLDQSWSAHRLEHHLASTRTPTPITA